MRIKEALFLAIFISFLSCDDKKDVKAVIYKKDKVSHEFYGVFFSTKYGGLNYYISDEGMRKSLFNIKNIDSIVFTINEKNYTSKPLISKAFSRERNDSDFSFLVNEKEHKIKVDTINSMCTLVIFSEKTDMEEMKDRKEIKFTMMDEESR